MSVTNVLHLLRRTAPQSDDAFLDGVREKLWKLETTAKPVSRKDQTTLDKLAGRLFSLHEKGFSFQEISSCLQQCDVALSADTIKQYFEQSHSKRLFSCEQMVAHCHKPEGNHTIERAALIESGLRQALKDQRGLMLYYQPQVDMHTGQVLGAEALLRWNFNGEMIDPAEVIPVAEASGLIVPIGEWVLWEACREAKRWQAMELGGKRGIKMGVNLSVKQFSDDLPNMVHSLLCDIGLPTKLLGLEITESCLVGNNSLPILNVFRQSGIHLSMDDFGTGYSCLSELKDLPLDTIKIDRAFVTDLVQGGSSLAIVETIIDLARKLKMDTLAEGVETEEQALILRRMGCSVGQGFLYAKPLPAADFVRFVQARSLG